ncbi:MAG: hypothetical protein GF364_21630 [Candidatus Lokiarchaeota archaeon]|nr:hypothetical protein [Candidatus Lokiarchaeota archaeon]
MKNRKNLKRILTVCSFILIVSSVYLFSQFTDNNARDLVVNNKTIDSSDNGGSELPYQIGPFFNHSDDDAQQYGKLIYEDYTKFVYQHSFDNTDEWELSDSNIYARDQFYYLLGYNQLLEGQLVVPNYIGWYQDIDLWDTESSEKGYYTYIDENLTRTTEEKLSFDNILAILSILTATGTNSSDVENRVVEQWDVVNELFWDSEASLFNQSNQATSKYSANNLLGAIAAFSIVREAEFNDNPGLINQAYDRGVEIMEELNSSYYDFVAAWPGYWESTTNSEKSALTNALGIIALLDWNIATNYTANSAKLNQSIKIYNFMKEELYNSTNDMYNKKMARSGGGLDYDLVLLDNAWMLKATLKLFEATGNITYYQDALKLYYGIESTLYDPLNYGYNTTFGPNQNTIKEYDDYNMYISALYDFKNIHDTAYIQLEKNESSYLYLNSTAFNVSLSLNYSMEYEYNTDKVNSSWNFEIPIENSPVHYILRYENDTIIEQKDQTTDINGTDEYIYDLSGLTTETYSLSVLCNYSGYCLTYKTEELDYVSGILIVNYTTRFEELYQGERGLINVSVGSLRDDNISINLEVSGGNFLTETVDDVNILNKTLTFTLINLTTVSDIETGVAQFNIVLYNNSLVLENNTFEITIESNIEVAYIQYSQYLIVENDLQVSLGITNHKSQSSEDNLHIEITSDYFVTLDQDLDSIEALSMDDILLDLERTASIYYGDIEFIINISREGESLYMSSFSLESVPELDIEKISSTDIIIQGLEPAISLNIINYNITAKTISIRSNEKTVWTGKLNNGYNSLYIPIDNKIRNPYSIKTRIYYIEILNEKDQVIGTEMIQIKPQISVSNAIFYYILPIIISLGVAIGVRYKEIKENKRSA